MFVIKIVRAKPEGVDISRWVELIFGLHERDIIQYETKKAFNIPGLYKPAPMVRIAGSKIPRKVSENQRIWVRLDVKFPDAIDFEAPIGIGCEPRIFQLSRDEWDHVKPWLSPVHRMDKKLHAEDCLVHAKNCSITV